VLYIYDSKWEKHKMGKLYRIDERKRITLPDGILDELDANPGDYLGFEAKNGKVIIKKKIIS